jgi:diketogulonate reductase-like aldo/keto reductase
MALARDENRRNPGWPHPFAPIFEVAFVVGERGFGTTGPRVRGGRRLDGLAAQLFDALADRREIVGGAGSGHIASLNRAEAGAMRPGSPLADRSDSAEPARSRREFGTTRDPRSAVAMPNPPMRSRPIPSTGEMMPVIGLGTWPVFDVGAGEAARQPLREVVRLLLDAGARMIDSSPMYGRAEAVTGDLLSELQARPNAFLATKVWTTGRDSGIEQMRRSAGLLRSEVVDLMQIHNLVDWRTHLATLRRMKEQGSIRYIGITHYTNRALSDLARILETEPGIDFVQCGYSLAARTAERELLPVASARGVAVIVNQPLGQGSLIRRVRGRALPEWAGEFDCASWAQLLLKYLLAEPAVTCVIPATRAPEHVADNLAAGFGHLPDAGQRRQIRALWDAS